MGSPRVQLPWYKFDFLADEYDRLWTRLRQLLGDEGFRELPEALDSSLNLDDVLRSPDLLLSQTCGYDIALDLPLRLKVVGTPAFATPGGERGFYQSLWLVRAESHIHDVSDFAGARFIGNDQRSWSGYHALREHWSRFGEITFSGSHLASVRNVIAHRADLACVDRVSWTLMERAHPEFNLALRCIGLTELAPAPPFVTSAERSEAEVQSLRRALRSLISAEPEVSARLLWRDLVPMTRSDYAYMAAPASLSKSLDDVLDVATLF